MKQVLSGFIEAIRNIPTEERLSDSALMALSKTFVSLYNTVVCEDLDAEFGNRRLYRDKLTRLYQIGWRRCSGNRDIARKCSLLSVLYEILYGLPLFDERKLEQCDDAAFRVIESFLHENDKQEWLTECNILKCIENAYRHTMEDDRESEEYTYFKRRIAEWISDWNSSGCWSGVSDEEALSRLDILVRNSETLLDDTHDAEIVKIHDRYYQKIIAGNVVDACTLALLYEITICMTGLKDRRGKRKRLAEMAENKLSVSAVGSDEYWWCLSLLIEDRSLQLSEELQPPVIAHSA